MTRLVVDANVVISALIADSTTRQLLVTLDPPLCTPAFVHDEIANYESLISEKSGLPPARVQQFVELLFQYIDVIPASGFAAEIESAEAALGDTDPQDVPYLACALAVDGSLWSDDTDFEAQELVDVYTTSDVIETFDTS